MDCGVVPIPYMAQSVQKKWTLSNLNEPSRIVKFDNSNPAGLKIF